MSDPVPPAGPAVTTASFNAALWPPALVRQVLDLLVAGSPFANSLDRLPIDRASLAFPTASPDRPAWTAEMGEIPVVGLGDDSYIVSVCKLASIILVSNEAVADTSVNLVAQLGNLLKDSASAELDRGCLYGQGAPEPQGVVAAATPAVGPDLAGALTNAIGSVGDNGGAISHLACRPSVLAQARNWRSATGQLLYPNGFGQAFGLTEVAVPELHDILAYDAGRVHLVVRNDFQVDSSQDFAYQQDAAAVRLRGRFAVALPSVDKALRRLEVQSSPTPEPASAQPGAPGGPRSSRRRPTTT